MSGHSKPKESLDAGAHGASRNRNGSQTNDVRLEQVERHRARREQEPAAAAFDTDGEAGNTTGRYVGTSLSRDGGAPVDPVEAGPNAPRTDPADVRAGPGDAGRQDRPERLPDTGRRRRSRGAVLGALALFIVGAALAAIMWLGAA